MEFLMAILAAAFALWLLVEALTIVFILLLTFRDWLRYHFPRNPR